MTAPSTVTVRVLRDHYGPTGMVVAGALTTRSAEDAAYLVSQGTVTIVTPAKSARAKA